MSRIEDKSWYKYLPPVTEDVNKANFEEFFKIMYERQEVWYKRFMLKQNPPWTDNKILRDYKFTNVYRELDRASQWLIKTVLMDHTLFNRRELLFRMIIGRFYNEPYTFDKSRSRHAIELPYYENFDAEELWEQTVNYRIKVGNPWHQAYLMNPSLAKPADWNNKGMFKDEVYCKHIFVEVHKKIGKLDAIIRTAKKPEDVIAFLETLPAVAGFMAHEFYIDMCYVARYWKEPLFEFTQMDYTNVGPGAKSGIRMIFPSLEGKDIIKGIYWLQELAAEELAKYKGFKYLEWNKGLKEYYITDTPNITLHQIEMWLCEFQKYKKMQWGAGKQRSKFEIKTDANFITAPNGQMKLL